MLETSAPGCCEWSPACEASGLPTGPSGQRSCHPCLTPSDLPLSTGSLPPVSFSVLVLSPKSHFGILSSNSLSHPPLRVTPRLIRTPGPDSALWCSSISLHRPFLILAEASLPVLSLCPSPPWTLLTINEMPLTPWSVQFPAGPTTMAAPLTVWVPAAASEQQGRRPGRVCRAVTQCPQPPAGRGWGLPREHAPPLTLNSLCSPHTSSLPSGSPLTPSRSPCLLLQKERVTVTPKKLAHPSALTLHVSLLGRGSRGSFSQYVYFNVSIT